jgi:hypothetical protein
LTRIPNRLTCAASALTNPAIPGLAARSSPTWPYTPTTEDTATIRPDRCLIMGSTAAREINRPGARPVLRPISVSSVTGTRNGRGIEARRMARPASREFHRAQDTALALTS